MVAVLMEKQGWLQHADPILSRDCVVSEEDGTAVPMVQNMLLFG